MAGLSRRDFLRGSLLLTAASVGGSFACRSLAGAKRFSGDDPELGHELLRDGNVAKRTGEFESSNRLYDVIVVGGGMAGLASAYLMRDHEVLLLESRNELGGVARSENWKGIEYSTGSSYIARPKPGTNIQELLRDLGSEDKSKNLAPENHLVIAEREIVGTVFSSENADFFRAVLHNRYPDVPDIDRELLPLDELTFEEFLSNPPLQEHYFGLTTGKLSPHAIEFIEYYCWGAFGASAKEISAYYGLNFFAAEFGDILVFPGGNAFIAKRLAEETKAARGEVLKTGFTVLAIEAGNESDGFVVTAKGAKNLHAFRGRSIIYSAPLLFAKRVVPFLLVSQREAINQLEYRGYVVANILLKKPLREILPHSAFRNVFAIARLRGVNVQANEPADLWPETVFTDAEVAEWSMSADKARSVLTLYCPLAFSAGLSKLQSAQFEDFELPIRDQVLDVFGPYGLRATHIDDVRLTRWGHAMLVAKPGQLAKGTLESAARQDSGLFFAHTDVFGAPSIENALQAAFRATEGVRRFLASCKGASVHQGIPKVGVGAP